jgi:hypothetical protein
MKTLTDDCFGKQYRELRDCLKCGVKNSCRRAQQKAEIAARRK